MSLTAITSLHRSSPHVVHNKLSVVLILDLKKKKKVEKCNLYVRTSVARSCLWRPGHSEAVICTQQSSLSQVHPVEGFPMSYSGGLTWPWLLTCQSLCLKQRPQKWVQHSSPNSRPGRLTATSLCPIPEVDLKSHAGTSEGI